MGPQSMSAVEDVLDNQILVLLQHQRRVTFLTLADSFPLYTWQSLFTALNRLRGQHHVELLPLPADYEVVWRRGHERSSLSPGGG